MSLGYFRTRFDLSYSTYTADGKTDGLIKRGRYEFQSLFRGMIRGQGIPGLGLFPLENLSSPFLEYYEILDWSLRSPRLLTKQSIELECRMVRKPAPAQMTKIRFYV